MYACENQSRIEEISDSLESKWLNLFRLEKYKFNSTIKSVLDGNHIDFLLAAQRRMTVGALVSSLREKSSQKDVPLKSVHNEKTGEFVVRSWSQRHAEQTSCFYVKSALDFTTNVQTDLTDLACLERARETKSAKLLPYANLKLFVPNSSAMSGCHCFSCCRCCCVDR